MQYRSPVGLGPSGNRWPRWESPCLLRTSTRTIPRLSVLVLHDVFLHERLGEARPPGAGVELVGGDEQGFAGNDIHIDAFLLVVPVLVRKGPLGALLLGHLVLERCQLLLDRLIRGSLVVFGMHPSHSSWSSRRPTSFSDSLHVRTRFDSACNAQGSFCSSPGGMPRPRRTSSPPRSRWRWAAGICRNPARPSSSASARSFCSSS